jgi:hypothetical protein
VIILKSYNVDIPFRWRGLRLPPHDEVRMINVTFSSGTKAITGEAGHCSPKKNKEVDSIFAL